MTEITTTPSGVELRCQEIDENDEELGTYVTYCKQYWGTQMKDYGTSTSPKADEYITYHKREWEEQAKRSEAQDHAEGDASDHAEGDTSEHAGGDTSEHEHGNLVEKDTIMSDEVDELGDNPTLLHSMHSMDIAGQMENSATNADYHEACHLLYAKPQSEQGNVDDSGPLLIRAEYSRIYDQLILLDREKYKAVVTGQPGIGKTWFLYYVLWRLVSDKVPVLWKIRSGIPYILFDEQQAYKVNPDSVSIYSEWKANRKMWILVDSIAYPDGIPSELRELDGPTSMVVYATSPRRSRWKLARQSNISLAIVIMNPWSKWEAELL